MDSNEIDIEKNPKIHEHIAQVESFPLSLSKVMNISHKYICIIFSSIIFKTHEHIEKV